MKFASLFSGGGLADLGLLESGMNHAFGVEWGNAECRVYKHVIGNVLNIDVRDSRLPQFIKKYDVDFLWTSPPCTEFTPARTRAFDEETADLAVESAKIIGESGVKYAVIENSENMRNYPHFKTIIETLKQYGAVNFKVIDPTGLGVPGVCRRHRVFVLFAKDSEKLAKWSELIPNVSPESNSNSLESVRRTISMYKFDKTFSDLRKAGISQIFEKLLSYNLNDGEVFAIEYYGTTSRNPKVRDDSLTSLRRSASVVVGIYNSAQPERSPVRTVYPETSALLMGIRGDSYKKLFNGFAMSGAGITLQHSIIGNGVNAIVSRMIGRAAMKVENGRLD